jgi:hypothetical protein
MMKVPAQIEGFADLADVTPDELLSLSHVFIEEELSRLPSACTPIEHRTWDRDG